MLKKYISLVFLFVTLCCSAVLSDTNSLILPKSKPEKIFIPKEIRKTEILPSKKPGIKKNVSIIQKNTLPKNKPENRDSINLSKKEPKNEILKKSQLQKKKF